MRRSLLAALLCFVMVPVSGCGGSDATSRGSTRDGVNGITRRPQPVVSSVVLPDVTESDAGAPFALRASEGGFLVVYFGYTHCPDVCPATMADLRLAKAELGAAADDVEVAMVTVDPARDTADVVRGYLDHFFDDYRVLRTEDPAALAAAQQAFGASSRRVDEPDGDYEMEHTASTYVVDDRGRIVLEWPFGTSPEAIAADLSRLLDSRGT